MIKPLVFLLFSLSLICFTINGQNLKDKEGKRTGKWIIFNSKDLKIEEGKIILNNLQKDDYLILLDERGKNLQSEELAKVLQKRNNNSTKQVIFLIGGAFGVSDEVIKRAVEVDVEENSKRSVIVQSVE